MVTRTSSAVVTFTRSFRLSAIGYAQPAGSYTIETDEERLDTRSLPAHRRVGTFIRVALPAGAAGSSSRIMIDPVELEAALARDVAPEQYGPETIAEHAAREGSRS